MLIEIILTSDQIRNLFQIVPGLLLLLIAKKPTLVKVYVASLFNQWEESIILSSEFVQIESGMEDVVRNIIIF